MTPYALVLVGLLCALFLVDYAHLRKSNRRLLLIEALVFLAGAAAILNTNWVQAMATRFGVGRGVDFVIYPLIVWLVREALLTRHAQWEQTQKLTRLVRAAALDSARVAKAE